jgi:RND family efflux transporter MFP subunit
MQQKRLFVAATLLLLLGGCREQQQQDKFIRSVFLTTPQQQATSSQKCFSGIVREANEVSLGFKTPGQLARIFVKEGDYIRRGQLLATLDDADYQLSVEALQIQYDQLHDEVARTRQLFEQKSISANDYEKASAGLKQLGVQLQATRNKLNYTKLYAPTDGYIQSVNFSVAEMVDAGTAVFTLLDVSHMEVVVDLPVNEYLQRDHFARFTCRIANEEYPLTLRSITPRADGNQLYQLRLAFVGNTRNRLTAGLNVEVYIESTDTTDSDDVSIEASALFQEDGQSYVWVYQADSTIKRHPVTVEQINTSGRVVVKGLNDTESIVRAGVNVLQEGEQVRVVTASNDTNVGGVL